MKTIVCMIKPGNKKGQMTSEEKYESANAYIELLKENGEDIESIEYLSDKVIILVNE